MLIFKATNSAFEHLKITTDGWGIALSVEKNGCFCIPQYFLQNVYFLLNPLNLLLKTNLQKADPEKRIRYSLYIYIYIYKIISL